MSRIDTDKPRFSAERRGDLQRLGLIDEQIEELEAILPMCCLLITDDPPLRDVRDELDLIAQATADARQKICKCAKTPAAHEARYRIDAASYALGGDLGETGRACAALNDLSRVVAQAISALGTKQRRTNRAANMPIKLIHEALIRGWGRRGPRLRGFGQQFNVKVSSAPKSVFREVVGICYQTMRAGGEEAEPLRAVKTYMAYLRGERKELSRQRDSVVTQDESFAPERFGPVSHKR
jgi:hypothetical protein